MMTIRSSTIPTIGGSVKDGIIFTVKNRNWRWSCLWRSTLNYCKCWRWRWKMRKWYPKMVIYNDTDCVQSTHSVQSGGGGLEFRRFIPTPAIADIDPVWAHILVSRRWLDAMVSVRALYTVQCVCYESALLLDPRVESTSIAVIVVDLCPELIGIFRTVACHQNVHCQSWCTLIVAVSFVCLSLSCYDHVYCRYILCTVHVVHCMFMFILFFFSCSVCNRSAWYRPLYDRTTHILDHSR